MGLTEARWNSLHDQGVAMDRHKLFREKHGMQNMGELSKELVQSSFLEVFKTKLNKALGNLA